MQGHGLTTCSRPLLTSMSNLARSGLKVMAVQLSLALQGLTSGSDFLQGA